MKSSSNSGLVYSTDGGRMCPACRQPASACTCQAQAAIKGDGKVRVSGTVAELVWNDEVAEIYFGPTLTARMRERYGRPEAVARV